MTNIYKTTEEMKAAEAKGLPAARPVSIFQKL
jgi:hypothetical protein